MLQMSLFDLVFKTSQIFILRLKKEVTTQSPDKVVSVANAFQMSTASFIVSKPAT